MKKNIFLACAFIVILAIFIFGPKENELPYFINEPDMIDVEITGAVKKPGTYKINKGMSLAYLVDLSGGLLESADISNMMLGMIMSESSYHIPNYELHIEPIVRRININTATYSEFIQIPNITENRALEILIYRKEKGQFKRLEELLEVKGIGVATFDKIKIYFYI